MKSVVLGLSGGLDSSTLCGFYLNRGYNVFPILFYYGSKHNIYEQEAAEKIAKFYNLELKKIDLNFIGQLFKSNLLKSGGDVPEGFYADSNMSQTVVPGRNVIFISIMMGYGWSVEADTVAVGVHSGDHSIYADCRPDFISAMNSAIIEGSDNRVHLEAPFQDFDKTKIIEVGFKLKIPTPYELTRTCYKDQFLSCGRCGSCVERLLSFHEVGEEDPIKYEDREYYKQYLKVLKECKQ